MGVSQCHQVARVRMFSRWRFTSNIGRVALARTIPSRMVGVHTNGRAIIIVTIISTRAITPLTLAAPVATTISVNIYPSSGGPSVDRPRLLIKFSRRGNFLPAIYFVFGGETGINF